MTTFKATVTYAAGHDQTHEGLTADQIADGTGFLRDLVHLQGDGITRLTFEIEGDKAPPPTEAQLRLGDIAQVLTDARPMSIIDETHVSGVFSALDYALRGDMPHGLERDDFQGGRRQAWERHAKLFGGAR